MIYFTYLWWYTICTWDQICCWVTAAIQAISSVSSSTVSLLTHLIVKWKLRGWVVSKCQHVLHVLFPFWAYLSAYIQHRWHYCYNVFHLNWQYLLIFCKKTHVTLHTFTISTLIVERRTERDNSWLYYIILCICKLALLEIIICGWGQKQMWHSELFFVFCFWGQSGHKGSTHVSISTSSQTPLFFIL